MIERWKNLDSGDKLFIIIWIVGIIVAILFDFEVPYEPDDSTCTSIRGC